MHRNTSKRLAKIKETTKKLNKVYAKKRKKSAAQPVSPYVAPEPEYRRKNPDANGLTQILNNLGDLMKRLSPQPGDAVVIPNTNLVVYHEGDRIHIGNIITTTTAV